MQSTKVRLNDSLLANNCPRGKICSRLWRRSPRIALSFSSLPFEQITSFTLGVCCLHAEAGRDQMSCCERSNPYSENEFLEQPNERLPLVTQQSGDILLNPGHHSAKQQQVSSQVPDCRCLFSETETFPKRRL